jgi:uncharacterized protein (DUF1810 family)
MWFVFPQVAGLGRSAMAQEYAISSVAEARAYLAHPVLGPRLRECARIVAGTEGRTAERIFGPVDAVKLRSSMTLFAAADTGEAGSNVFGAVLAKYFGGVPDEATVARLLRRNNAGQHRRVEPGLPGRGIVGHAYRKVDMSVRWAYVHMLEEYARHNGHADLLRERIDGKTGM